VLIALTSSALLAYLAAAFFFLSGLTRKRRAVSLAGLTATWIGAVLQLAAIIGQAVTGGGSGLLAMPNGLTLVAFLLVVGYLALERIYRVREVGMLVTPLAVIALAVQLLSHPELAPAHTGSDSLLKFHVMLAFVGTALFALAFFLAILYSVQDRQLREKKFGALYRSLPALNSLDTVGFRCISIGFPVYTAAILLGFVSATRVGLWNSPSMVLALVTWLLFGLVLQARLTAGWRGRKAALITIAGFLAAVGVVIVYVVR
jgi:ABC-type uncharacterized transport system permease subunit